MIHEGFLYTANMNTEGRIEPFSSLLSVSIFRCSELPFDILQKCSLSMVENFSVIIPCC